MQVQLAAAGAASGLDGLINDLVEPLARRLSEVVFFAIPFNGGEVQLVVLWLIVGAVYFTGYFRFVNLRGFREAVRLVTGRYADPDDPGEVSHFQALATAVSGTVGVGNIAHVAIAVSVGGPGATFWMVVAGLLGMSSKFVECTLGVKYRDEAEDGTVLGGPMYYLRRGLAERGWPRLGKVLAAYYAVCIIAGCLGIGSMFQSNQAYVQLVNVTGGEASALAGRGWLFGFVLAAVVGAVIIGGIRSIARVTSTLVPFMAALYLLTAWFVIAAYWQNIPAALVSIVTGAFSPEGFSGGMVGVLLLGFRRAAFSNEAGIGSASIAHAAVRTREPVTEGLVALLEPFIDTVIVCSTTALVIAVSGVQAEGLSGVELTSDAFASVVSWFPIPLAVVVMLFAFSTMVSWSYYGLAGWLYLVGRSRPAALAFNLVFCLSVAVGSATQLSAILDFSDAMVFAMAFANVFGLYMLAPVVREELAGYSRGSLGTRRAGRGS
jgi:AGCS family alanine or glycine:cation symporter